jgi:hypothetical protein
MNYVAEIRFQDIDGEIYEIGDVYPRECLTEKRIRQLSTADNRTGKPVIAMSDDDLRNDELPDFDAMSDDDLRAFAAENGIEIAPQVTKRETIIERITQGLKT